MSSSSYATRSTFFYLFLAVLAAKTTFCFSAKVHKLLWSFAIILILAVLIKLWNLNCMALAGLCSVHGKHNWARPR